jgi:hypothetical protein
VATYPGARQRVGQSEENLTPFPNCHLDHESYPHARVDNACTDFHPHGDSHAHSDSRPDTHRRGHPGRDPNTHSWCDTHRRWNFDTTPRFPDSGRDTHRQRDDAERSL